MCVMCARCAGVLLDKGGVWRQNGTVQIGATAGGVLIDDGMWEQNAHTSVNVTESSESMPGAPVCTFLFPLCHSRVAQVPDGCLSVLWSRS
jgi:hypothetical protein